MMTEFSRLSFKMLYLRARMKRRSAPTPNEYDRFLRSNLH